MDKVASQVFEKCDLEDQARKTDKALKNILPKLGIES